MRCFRPALLFLTALASSSSLATCNAYTNPFTTVVLNKPKDTLCSHFDPNSNLPTIYSFLPSASHRWHAVGRLDAATTGALLVTTDTKLVAHATTSAVPKLYEARCMGILDEDQLQALRSGVDLRAGLGMSKPCEVDVVSVERKVRVSSCLATDVIFFR